MKISGAYHHFERSLVGTPIFRNFPNLHIKIKVFILKFKFHKFPIWKIPKMSDLKKS